MAGAAKMTLTARVEQVWSFRTSCIPRLTDFPLFLASLCNSLLYLTVETVQASPKQVVKGASVSTVPTYIGT